MGGHGAAAAAPVVGRASMVRHDVVVADCAQLAARRAWLVNRLHTAPSHGAAPPTCQASWKARQPSNT